MDNVVKLITSEYDFVRQYCLKIVGNPYDADDLAQEVMIKAIRNADKFSEGTNIRGWLTTISKNKFLDAYRKQKRNIELDLEDAHGYDIADDEYKDIADKSYEPISEDLVEAIQSLPNQYSSIAIRSLCYDKSYEEIATQEGLPVGTIKSRLFKVRQLLRAQLKEKASEYNIKYRREEEEQEE